MTHEQAKATLSHVKPAHTPGPWKIVLVNGSPSAIEVRDQHNRTIHHEELMFCGGSAGKRQFEIIEKRCCLIAAAPETAAERDRLKEINLRLLDTLKFVLEDHNSVIDYECGEIIRATIAKAEGK